MRGKIWKAAGNDVTTAASNSYFSIAYTSFTLIRAVFNSSFSKQPDMFNIELDQK